MTKILGCIIILVNSNLQLAQPHMKVQLKIRKMKVISFVLLDF